MKLTPHYRLLHDLMPLLFFFEIVESGASHSRFRISRLIVIFMITSIAQAS